MTTAVIVSHILSDRTVRTRYSSRGRLSQDCLREAEAEHDQVRRRSRIERPDSPEGNDDAVDASEGSGRREQADGTPDHAEDSPRPFGVCRQVHAGESLSPSCSVHFDSTSRLARTTVSPSTAKRLFRSPMWVTVPVIDPVVTVSPGLKSGSRRR